MVHKDDMWSGVGRVEVRSEKLYSGDHGDENIREEGIVADVYFGEGLPEITRVFAFPSGRCHCVSHNVGNIFGFTDSELARCFNSYQEGGRPLSCNCETYREIMKEAEKQGRV